MTDGNIVVAVLAWVTGVLSVLVAATVKHEVEKRRKVTKLSSSAEALIQAIADNGVVRADDANHNFIIGKQIRLEVEGWRDTVTWTRLCVSVGDDTVTLYGPDAQAVRAAVMTSMDRRGRDVITRAADEDKDGVRALGEAVR